MATDERSPPGSEGFAATRFLGKWRGDTE